MRQRLSAIAEPLLQWYDKNKRELPWRSSPKAYHVWVSEIMLQQTRVEAVKEYYKRFLEALPTVSKLAEADEDTLLKLWEGLGYYNRVRNMQKAAKTVVEQYDGSLPADYAQLLSLSGIGSYTAGAIASIAYGIPKPAVDGNVLRVVMRILEQKDDISKQSVKKSVETLLEEVMPKSNPGAFNQAMMELGATVCVPNGAPHCGKCPVAHLCLGYRHGTATCYPYKAPKKLRRIEERTVLVILDEEHAVLRKRDSKGLLAGLYEIPNVEGYMEEEDVLAWMEQEGFLALHMERLPDAKHIFSHVEWRMRAYRIKVSRITVNSVEDNGSNQSRPLEVIKKKSINEEVPIPSAFSYYRDYLTGE